MAGDVEAGPARGRSRPSEESRDRYFELPFAVTGQPLVRPDLDLVSMVSRGPEHSYAIDVTILDAADLRLTRAGVTLAHRVADGRGDWFLSAPGWAPALPTEAVHPMDDSDLPAGLAELVLPFRRRAALEPVAALHCERADFLVRGAQRETRAIVHDDRVTVRRGGVTVSRYREVTLRPRALSRKQLGWLTEALQAVGGTRVAELPPQASRLGVPASGLSGPEPGEWDVRTDLEGFVTALLRTRLREWLVADLAVRTGADGAGVELVLVLTGLAGELRGLAGLLEPEWSAETSAELRWVVRALGAHPEGADAAPAPGVLSSQRYLNLLETVVQASTVPRLGTAGGARATDALGERVREAVQELLRAGRGLATSAPVAGWVRLAEQADQAHAATLVARRNLPGWARKVDRRVGRISALLPGCVDPQLPEIERSVEDLGVQQAFAAGRRYEQLLRAQTRARRELLTEWKPARSRLRAAVRASW